MSKYLLAVALVAGFVLAGCNQAPQTAPTVETTTTEEVMVEDDAMMKEDEAMMEEEAMEKDGEAMMEAKTETEVQY